MKNTRSRLVKKHGRLVTAYKKVEAKLAKFSKDFNDIPKEDLGIEQAMDLEDSWRWNEHHDLRSRLEMRIHEVSVEIGCHDFDTKGFSVINIKN